MHSVYVHCTSMVCVCMHKFTKQVLIYVLTHAGKPRYTIHACAIYRTACAALCTVCGVISNSKTLFNIAINGERVPKEHEVKFKE